MDGWLTTDPTSLAQTFNQRQRLFFAVALSNSAHVLVSDAPVCSALPSFMSSLRSHTVRCPRLMAHDSLRPSTPRAPATKGFPIVVDNIARTTFHAPAFYMTSTFMLPACAGAVAGRGAWHGCTRHPWGQSGYAREAAIAITTTPQVAGPAHAGGPGTAPARRPGPCKVEGAATFK